MAGADQRGAAEGGGVVGGTLTPVASTREPINRPKLRVAALLGFGNGLPLHDISRNYPET